MTPAPNVVEICSELIRIDTTNLGKSGSRGELAAASYVRDLLRGAGFDPVLLESAPTRANLVLRVRGSSPDLPGVLAHGHLDVVPADEAQWSVPPFEGRIADGYVWGRGAMDMKYMIAMMVCTLVSWGRAGFRPRRDIVFAFVADEEQDGQFGAEWLVDNHPELFSGVVAGISESGGQPVDVTGPDGVAHRFYPVAAAEKGSLHMSVLATGTAGHGSLPNDDNPVVHLVRGLQRIADLCWPLQLTPAVKAGLRDMTATLGIEAADFESEAGVGALLEQIGELRRYVEPALRCSTTVTVLEAGTKMNVIPRTARAEIDVRSLPGADDEMLTTIDRLLGPAVSRTMLSNSRAISAPLDSEWYDAIRLCVEAADPGSVVVPYCMAGGTDAKPYARLGIAGYGFAPLGPDPDGRCGDGIHGVDERVPIASLEAGQRILQQLLETI